LVDKNSETFDTFKLKVLSEIIDWHHKTKGIVETVENNSKVISDYVKYTKELKKVVVQKNSFILQLKKHLSYLTH